MHILSAHYRSEFLATPILVRLDYVIGKDGHEPSLLIKTSTLMLKYIVQGIRMNLIVAKLQDRLLYGIKIFDDSSYPSIIWSIVEKESEKMAFEAIVKKQKCMIYLFNELAINVTWTQVQIPVTSILNKLVPETKIATIDDYDKLKDDVSEIFKQIEKHDFPINSMVVDIPNKNIWNPIEINYITNGITNSPIDFFNPDEGNEQEQLAIWLTDNLHPLGAYHSPQIPKGNNYRELTDILLSYEHGSFLIESKTLTVFNRTPLPDRKKLSRNVSSHIKKAINQLKGGIRRLKAGAQITKTTGGKIDVERLKPIHAIVLIPELQLVNDPTLYGNTLIQDFIEVTGGFIHLLDISELLRVVQAAEMISSRSSNVTPMMAFDYYLMERSKTSYEKGTLCIEVLLRFEKE